MKITNYRIPGFEYIAEAVPEIENAGIHEEVGMGEWRIREKGILVTVGASTCIVLAAHNEQTGKALLGHFASISSTAQRYNNAPQFEQAVGSIDDIGDPTSTDVWLGGGASFLERGVDVVETERLFAEERIARYLGENGLAGDRLTVAWSRPDQVIDVALDAFDGSLSVAGYPRGAGWN